MTLRLLLAMMATSAAYAGPVSGIDISSESTQLIRSGDIVVFHLFTWNFAKNAERLNLPLLVTDLNFALITAPVPDAGAFEVALASEDHSVTAEWREQYFTSGAFSGSAYKGEISTLQGHLPLSAEFSKVLLDEGSMVISLRNRGPDIVLGLATYLLRQDLVAGLSGGPLTVGALPGWVEFQPGVETLSPSLHLTSEGKTVSADEAVVPEPDSSVTFLIGMALFCFLPTLLTQFPARETGPIASGKSAICIRIPTLILSRWQIGILPLNRRKSTTE